MMYRGETLEEIERAYILAALKAHDGNRLATAAQLGISIRCLRMKLTKYERQGCAMPTAVVGGRRSSGFVPVWVEL